MNRDKWRSIIAPKSIYEELVAIAHIEGRTISGMLRYVFEEWKTKNLTKTDMRVLHAKIVENREQEARDEQEAKRKLIEKEIKEGFRAAEARAGIESLAKTSGR